MIKQKSLLVLLYLALVPTVTMAQTSTAFNFQGRLNDGSSPANGRFDLRFRLYDAPAGGGTVATDNERLNVQLIDGVFGTVLDYGPNAFQSGVTRYIEIGVRPAGSPNAYVVLGGRQAILSVPYAITSIYSAFAGVATNATNAENALALGGNAASSYARLNFDNQGDLKATGNLEIGGRATQPAASLGLPKAMIYVNGSGSAISCYNGVTGQSTGSCGFTVQEAPGSVGVYNIDFGFNIFNRFISLTAEYGASQNKGANFKFVATTRVDVWTFFTDLRSDTARSNFMIIVY